MIKLDDKSDDINDRPGKFKISVELLELKPHLIMQVMARCIVTRAEQLWHERVIEYVGYSPDFQLVKMGSRLPEYVWRFHKDELIGAERVDNIPSGNGSSATTKRIEQVVKEQELENSNGD